MKRVDKAILRLALPSILANITIPLVGMVDTAVAGHLPSKDGILVASFIGAISLGSVFFNLLYWNCSFLRSGTGGLTAQAYGRGDKNEMAKILVRGLLLTAVFAFACLLFQFPFVKICLAIVGGSEQVERLAQEYFLIRIWAAPATLALMTFSGWFVGMQDSISSMWKDLVVNIVNVVASIILSFGIGSWEGMGFAGVALGTVIAQYSGLAFCCVVVSRKYNHIFEGFRLSQIKDILKGEQLRSYFKMNADLFVRSLCFTAIYIGYTVIATALGDVMLACSTIMMQLLMLFSYFTDGFAYAGEALTGRFIGERNVDYVKRSIKHIFYWSMGIAVAFIGVYWIGGMPLLRLLTNDATVIDTCSQYMFWLYIMPPLGCAAFTWDGIFLGATATKAIRNSMLGAAAFFLAFWFAGKLLFNPDTELAMTILMVAYFSHLAFRTVYLSANYKKSVLDRAL